MPPIASEIADPDGLRPFSAVKKAPTIRIIMSIMTMLSRNKLRGVLFVSQRLNWFES